MAWQALPSLQGLAVTHRSYAPHFIRSEATEKGPQPQNPSTLCRVSLSATLSVLLGRRKRTQRRMFGSLVESLVESPAEQLRRRLEGRLQEINAMEERFAACGDQQLVEEAETLRCRAKNGEALDELLPEAFALVREASKRTLQLRHFDVQILGGIVLHEGQVAEMATGEGKTLVAILPAFLNALTGEGVHVVTTNDYLARRDAAWVGRVLRFLGLTVGVIQSDMTPSQKREAYRCDVTYVTNQQLGFDYLRDQMANLPDDLRLRQESYIL